jgi:hypothetical protein
LDTDGKGFITYHNFCNLTDERRRQIDPAKQMVDEYMQKQQNHDPHQPPAKRSPKNAIAPDEREKERQRKANL